MPFARRSALGLFATGALLACGAVCGCREARIPDRLTPITAEKPVWPLAAMADRAENPAEYDWPAWRGGGRQGVAAGDPPVRWAPDDASWSVEVPGEGNSSPIVCEGRVFLTSLVETDGGDSREASETPQLTLLCYRRDSGELLWRRELGSPDDRSHRKNGHASSTVACDGEQVFAFGGSLGLFCFDLDGRLLWNAPLGAVEHPWGVASSPVVYGGLVLQLCDSHAESSLVALNAATGRRVWTAPRESQGCWSTPVVVERDTEAGESPIVVVNGSSLGAASAGFVTAYDLATGEEVWKVRGTTDIPCPTPIIAKDNNDRTIVISSSGGHGPIFAIRPEGRGDVTATDVVWKIPRGGPYVPTGVSLQGRLYLVNDGGTASCYDVNDGRQVWRKRLRGAFSASLTAAAGRIYAVNEQGDVYVLAAEDEYNLLAVNRMKERCLATPALCGSQLFLRTERRLYCVEQPAPVVASEAAVPAESREDVEAVTAPSPSDRAVTPAAFRAEVREMQGKRVETLNSAGATAD